MKSRIERFRDKNLSDNEIKDRFKLKENYMWRISEARRELMAVTDWEKYFAKILYRPFDIREIYYHDSVVWRTRKKVMKHMLKENVALCIGRQWSVIGSQKYDIVYVTDKIVDFNLFRRGGELIFPLYLYSDSEKKPNFSPEFLEFIWEKYGRELSPEEIFYYIYAVLYSPAYRDRYEEFLRYDFPRIPFVDDYKRFKRLSELGKELVELHLMRKRLKTSVKFDIPGSNIVEKVRYEEGKVWINKEQYFEGIAEDVWNFYIGGYKVLDKWLKSRKGRKLSGEEIMQFIQIVEILKKTMEIMGEIDKEIEF